MPDKLLLSSVHGMLEESRWFPDIAKSTECPSDAYVNNSDRMVLWQGLDLRFVTRILENRMDTWLRS